MNKQGVFNRFHVKWAELKTRFFALFHPHFMTHFQKRFFFPQLLLVICWSLLPFPTWAEPNTSCVQIYYDQAHIGSNFKDIGQIHAIFLKNLLGHFREIKNIYLIPVSTYQPGQLNTCQTNFYLGSFNNNQIPEAYLKEFVTTGTTAVWISANINQLGTTNLKNLWGVQFKGVAKLDWDHPNALGEPGFYKDYLYKGEVFSPSATSIDYRNNPEFATVQMMQPLDAKAISYVTSWIKYNSSSLKIPYILHNQTHWYVGAMPLEYLERGSYLIFCDALFDILNLPPRHPGKKPALIRIEDVNAGYTNPIHMLSITNLFTRLKIPFSIAMIPIFKDPLMFLKKDPKKLSIRFSDNPELYKSLLYAKAHGASFIWHGVTHQYNSVKNPFNGMSGADFEFWNAKAKAPIQEDSVAYILNRLQMGADIIAKTPIKPIAWMSPHYLASSLDYTIFGEVFLWSVGKVYYIPDCISEQRKLPTDLTFDQSWPGNVKERLAFLSSLKVDCGEKPANQIPEGQFFPYEIFKDYYGQRVIPENLGNLQPYLNNQVIQVQTVMDIIQTAKRNRVIRDVWASFFIHPSLLNTASNGGISRYPGDTKWLEDLVTQIQSLDYEFVDLNVWTKNNL
jgi:uncharacterized protein YdaL